MQPFHTGRLIDHVAIRVKDFDASKRFYRAVLGVLGVPISDDNEHTFSADELYIGPLDAGAPPSPHGIHLAFQARDQETVHRFHAAAIAAGGRDNGAPGLRRYHANYYAAFVLDPDGNNIEAVFQGPTRRSAPSVLISPAD
ncbi:VOC family protein [Pyxidicoccus parkwayensis]|uniref:VOC family protein n=1 Tax=Pyxidicoccus parkwayensis TaxID=2813578 RepID=A0ABX7P9H0_9BACT|nr:VOC family protein [Pyxidicoccus parkwaysis]QSQ27158.1 VOC family protein [Pyxidicoccus parkwaysis]